MLCAPCSSRYQPSRWKVKPGRQLPWFGNLSIGGEDLFDDRQWLQRRIELVTRVVVLAFVFHAEYPSVPFPVSDGALEHVELASFYSRSFLEDLAYRFQTVLSFLVLLNSAIVRPRCHGDSSLSSAAYATTSRSWNTMTKAPRDWSQRVRDAS